MLPCLYYIIILKDTCYIRNDKGVCLGRYDARIYVRMRDWRFMLKSFRLNSLRAKICGMGPD